MGGVGGWLGWVGWVGLSWVGSSLVVVGCVGPDLVSVVGWVGGRVEVEGGLDGWVGLG